MRTAIGFPNAAEVAALTPADRDRALDVIRIVALIVVMVGHTLVSTSMICDHGLIWDNVLTNSNWNRYRALSWIFQIMPLFFFAGAAGCVTSWQPGTNWGSWLMKRCTRLFRPVFYYLGFWAVTLIALNLLLPQHIYEPIAGVSIEQLWFLGAYVLVLAAIPVLSRITTTGRLAAGVASVYGLILSIDVVRLHWPIAAELGYLNFGVWLIPAMFGIAYRRQLLTGRRAVGTAVALFAVDLALLRWGPYEPSMINFGNRYLSNTRPPSLLLAGHAIIMSALAIVAIPAINRWARRPRVWWMTVIGNSGVMTLYLWHIPALLGVQLLFDYFGHPRHPSQRDFVAVSAAQLLIMVIAVAVLFVLLQPLENKPLFGWDGAATITSAKRGAAVGALLCVAGVATLTSVTWGLKNEGLICVAVMVVALAAARVLASEAGRRFV